jgi:hypothetical protein
MKHFGVLASGLLLALPAAAQSGALPIRALGPVLATSTVPLLSIAGFVPLSDGRVFVSDSALHLAVQLDAQLANPRIVLDSVAGNDNSYPPGSRFIAFRGDSALFWPMRGPSMIVIDPAGKLARTFAAPSRATAVAPGDAGWAIQIHPPAVAPTLGFLYRAGVIRTPFAEVRDPQHPEIDVRMEDSATLIRMELTTRAIDTLARFSLGTVSAHRLPVGGSPATVPTALPFPFFDEAVVTTDGSIAIFRAREYRLEWINPDGTRTQGPRIDYPWHRITDDERQRLVDSVNAKLQKASDDSLALHVADSTRLARTPAAPPPGGATGIGTAARVQRGTPLPHAPLLLTSADIPEYQPPTSSWNAVRADAENRVWIRPIATERDADGAVWDVIDRQGVRVDRVRVPYGWTIAGFGSGVVYLSARKGPTWVIEKVRLP